MRLVLAACFVCTLVGCSNSGDVSDQTLVADAIALNKQTAESIGKAKDMDAFLAAMSLHEQGYDKIGARYRTLSRRQQESYEQDQQQIEPSAKRVHEAVTAFQERMQSGPQPQVVIDTSFGPIKLELYEKLAPITVKNFLRYTDEKFYDGTIFHRVIPTFMIQGGGFRPDMKEKSTHPSIKNEAFNLVSNDRGTIAMARTNVPDSASSQFFINVANNKELDRVNAQDGVGYAVFGRVVDGMDVVDKIKAVPTTMKQGHGDVPIKDVMINSVRRVAK